MNVDYSSMKYILESSVISDDVKKVLNVETEKIYQQVREKMSLEILEDNLVDDEEKIKEQVGDVMKDKNVKSSIQELLLEAIKEANNTKVQIDEQEYVHIILEELRSYILHS